eukprot:scaffold3826_cov407-Prasinococcus_capsulatus_cf.AAC.22
MGFVNGSAGVERGAAPRPRCRRTPRRCGCLLLLLSWRCADALPPPCQQVWRGRGGIERCRSHSKHVGGAISLEGWPHCATHHGITAAAAAAAAAPAMLVSASGAHGPVRLRGARRMLGCKGTHDTAEDVREPGSCMV